MVINRRCFLLHAGRAWVAWAFRGSPVDGVTGRSGDLDAVGRYRGTRDSGEKGDGRYGMTYCKSTSNALLCSCDRRGTQDHSSQSVCSCGGYLTTRMKYCVYLLLDFSKGFLLVLVRPWDFSLTDFPPASGVVLAFFYCFTLSRTPFPTFAPSYSCSLVEIKNTTLTFRLKKKRHMTTCCVTHGVYSRKRLNTGRSEDLGIRVNHGV